MKSHLPSREQREEAELADMKKARGFFFFLFCWLAFWWGLYGGVRQWNADMAAGKYLVVVEICSVVLPGISHFKAILHVFMGSE